MLKRIDNSNNLLKAKQTLMQIRSRSTAPFSNFHKGFSIAAGGQLLNVAALGFQLSGSQRSEITPAAVSSTIGLATYPIYSGIITVGLTMLGLPPGISSVAASLLAGIPNAFTERTLFNKVNWLGEAGKKTRAFELGRSYIDTDTNKTLRANALQELSFAFQPARRFLGQESRLLHR